MEAEHVSRYARLMSSLAREALDAAEAAPTRADAPGHPARLGIPAARVLLDPTQRDEAGLQLLDDALRTGQTRFNDTLGFTRPVYHPLLAHLWVCACGETPVSLKRDRPIKAGPASAGLERVHVNLWWALCRYETQEHIDVHNTVDDLLTKPGDDGALHPRSPDDQLDAWTWRELTGLHALAWLAELDDNDRWRRRVRAIAEHHQRVTQPDYTTYQPWGIAAFLLSPGTQMFADQQLHDARTNLHLEGGGGSGGAGLLPGLLLADAANLLRHVEAKVTV